MRKTVITVLSILVFIGFLYFLIPVGVNLYLNNNADRIVTNMITRTSTFGDHDVHFGDINFNYSFSGTFLRLKNVTVLPSERVSGDKIKFSMELDELGVTGFNWMTFLFQNTISVDSALLSNIYITSAVPPIEKIIESADSADRKSKKKRKENRDYDLIAVKNFDLQNMNIEVVDFQSDSTRLSLSRLDIETKDFEMTYEDIHSRDALFTVSTLHGRIEEALFHFDEFRQYVHVKDIDLDTQSESLQFGLLGLYNKLGRYEFASQFDHRIGFLEIDKTQMDFRGFHFDSFLREGIIEVDSLYVNGIDIHSFMDKRKPDDMNRRPPMLHTIFQNLEQIVHIQNLFITDGHIRVEERPENGVTEIAFLYFTDLNAHATNLSNYKAKQLDDQLMVIEASAKLMGEGLLKTTIKHDLGSEVGYFTLNGTLHGMDLTSVNTMIAPEAKARLKSGKNNRLDFNIEADQHAGRGEVIVRYENLEIQLLNPDLENQNLLRKVGSFLANTFIVKSSNPKKNGELIKGTVYYVRDNHKPIFYYWWQLLFSGLKSTLTGDELDDLKKKEQAKLEPVEPEEEKKKFRLFGKKNKAD